MAHDGQDPVASPEVLLAAWGWLVARLKKLSNCSLTEEVSWAYFISPHTPDKGSQRVQHMWHACGCGSTAG